MTNDEKADIYHSLLLKHDKLDGKIADIKAQAAGSDLNVEQQTKVNKLEIQKEEVVSQAQQLFETY
ncbi:hypothetical protein CL614_08630 [archaeon]|jgi:uncharacterized protein YdcH (DUF465 family)|nr:hypothetical protein [archaeon]|tara:strand:+ start:1509 stop:1706 length:198 start_codon:yes stop_codon:yes gene_type:complete